MQVVLHGHQALLLSLVELGHGDSGPVGHHIGDVIIGHHLAQHAAVLTLNVSELL